MNPTPPDNNPHRDNGLSPQIKKRIAIAGGLALVALASIPVIDSFSKPDTQQTPASTPVSSGRILQKEASAAAPTLSLSAIDASAPGDMPAAPNSSAPSHDTGHSDSPQAPTPGSPATVTPLHPPKIQSPAPAPHNAAATNSNPVKNNTTPDKTTVAPVAVPPAKSSSKPTAAPALPAAAASVESAKPPFAEAPAIPVAKKPAIAVAPTGSSFGYQVQLGLFSSPSNAEKLITDLKKHGIAARTETRVQMGPFRTRAEAEEAMQQLKALGYQPLLIPAGQR